MKLPAFFSSLRVVLALQVALPVLAALALVLVAAMSLFGHFVESRMQRDLQLVARAIHLPVTQALARGDIEQLESSLASAFGMTEVYGAYLFDADGRRLVGFGMVSPTRRQAGDALKLTLEGEFAQYENIRGQNVYSFFLPLFDSIGQPNGLLQVTRLRSDIEHELSQLRRRAWGGFGAAALIILVVFALAHRRAVGRPLSALVDSMQRVEEGELGHRAAQMMAVMYLFFIDRNYYSEINSKFTELFAVYVAAESIKVSCLRSVPCKPLNFKRLRLMPAAHIQQASDVTC